MAPFWKSTVPGNSEQPLPDQRADQAHERAEAAGVNMRAGRGDAVSLYTGSSSSTTDISFPFVCSVRWSNPPVMFRCPTFSVLAAKDPFGKRIVLEFATNYEKTAIRTKK